jgi:hypothetical protein
MKHKSTLIIITIISLVIISYASVKHSSAPPTGYTGASGTYCTSCHTGHALNTAGGSVVATGLPTVTFIPGQAYNFSLKITHSAADRKRWGFSIAARNSYGSPIGTWSTTNPNAAISGTELGHSSAVSTSSSSTYTYSNLTWTAPTNPVIANGDDAVTFYYVGVAADGSGSGGDYVYAANISTPLPVIVSSFAASVNNTSVNLKWQTFQEINSSYFIVEKSIDNRQYVPIGRINAIGNSSVIQNYSFTDDKPSYFDKPVYYRLAMVDKNASKYYSKIVNVTIKGIGTYVNNIYPNPATAGSILHINLIARHDETITLQLIDNLGREHRTIQKNASEGTNIMDITIPSTAAGTYILVVKSSSASQQIPLLIR